MLRRPGGQRNCSVEEEEVEDEEVEEEEVEMESGDGSQACARTDHPASSSSVRRGEGFGDLTHGAVHGGAEHAFPQLGSCCGE